MNNISIKDQALISCRHLLSSLNRDPATTSTGCFDRRFWAWKLIDFPEATFQRNAAPLAWYLSQVDDQEKVTLRGWIKQSLLFSAKIQHRDGSFDQAYPNERSYGATAFLLPDLISAYESILPSLNTKENTAILDSFKRGADFLCKSREQHGLISNHIAGAALGLLKAQQLFKDQAYLDTSREIVQTILTHQSKEGWFPEYNGADPGYQTLCMYYLAQIYRMHPNANLRDALKKSLDFLTYFYHPDGTFGGEYGSRRTEIYYPGGIALLADEFPAAAVLTEAMINSIENRTTATVLDVDFGNTAPLLSNYILAINAPERQQDTEPLPYVASETKRNFSQAGIHIHGNANYYAVFGTSNGGVLKVFDKAEKKQVFDDGGLLGVTQRGSLITSQIPDHEAQVTIEENGIQTQARMSYVPTTNPTPLNYLFLRVANLTLMRVPFLNEWIKKWMVKTLIKKDDHTPIQYTRRVEFGTENIKIVDRVKIDGRTTLTRLRMGIKFSAIHMASARYFSPQQLSSPEGIELDCKVLNHTGGITQSLQIDIKTGSVEKLI